MGFALPPFVGFCHIGTQAIFLDARADRYWMLPEPHGEALRRLAEGGKPGADDIKLLNALVETGVLARTDGGTRPIACALSRARGSRLDTATAASGTALASAWIDFRLAARSLRRNGLERSLLRLDRERRGNSLDGRQQARSVAGFVALRAWVSPVGNCLPLSLALATRCGDAETRLVFGVKLHPFAAHAWVQRKDIVLNDDVHVVTQFTPVLAL